MRILVIITEAPPIMSGVARVGEELALRLRAAGHAVDLLSSNEIPRIALGELRLSSMLWKGFGPAFLRLREYDVIHIHGPAPTFSDVALLFAALRRASGGPSIVYTHHCEIELPGKELLCAPYNGVHRLLAGLADQIVVSTPSYTRLFAGAAGGDRISVIPWGGRRAGPPAAKAPGMHVLFVGQLRPYKGLDVLLRAMAALDLPQAQLTVVGSGHRELHYHGLARRLGLRQVRFLGRASEEAVAAAYAEAHVLVLPSLTRAEAFGLVLLEGMAAGCVPVVSQLPGLTDVIGDAGRSFLTGSHESLAAVLRELAERPGELERRAAVARLRAERFSWDATAAAYERLFATLVGRRASIAVDWFTSIVGASAGVAAGEVRCLFPGGHEQHLICRLLRMVGADFDAARVSLMLLEPAGEALTLAAAQGLDPGLLGARAPLHQSVAGWVARSGRALCLQPAGAPQELRQYLRRPELSTALCVPVRQGERVAGVLSIARGASGAPYTADDLEGLIHCTKLLSHQRLGLAGERISPPAARARAIGG
jgi:rhamnosyl/mannosyltransferase